MLEHEGFLLFELYPNARGDENQAEPAMEPAKLKGGRGTHQKYAGVNRMTHKAIETGFNELMSLLESNVAAPISRERPARPQADEQAEDANGRSHNAGRVIAGCERIIPGERHVKFTYCDRTRNHQDAIGQGGTVALALRGGLNPKRTDEPIDREDGPTTQNDITRNRHIKSIVSFIG